MIRSRKPNPAQVSGLRTRYFPKSRIGQGLVSIAPWADVVLLLVLFALLNGNFVVQPGVVVRVPEAPFTEGSWADMTVVVLPIGGAGSEGQEVVYFDDKRFVMGDLGEMEDLKQSFAGKKRPGVTLVVQADEQVRHGTVVKIMNMAREVGIARVNVAERTSRPGEGETD